jgi:uracil-DNA glycosylase
MDEIQRELLDIVTQVRTHLDYQKALGVRVIAVAVPSSVAPLSHRAPKIDASPSTPPVANQKVIKAVPPSARGDEGGTSAHPETLDSIREELGECVRCKLHKGRKTIVFGEGDAEAKLVFVGEGPGFEEDQQGRPFVGEAGQLLTDIIVKGMKLRREEVYICNVVKCRPPGNRNPEPDEIAACEPFLRKQLHALKPRVIVTLGNVPTHTLLKTKEGITRLRGKWQSYDGVPLMPTFHPAYLLRNPKDKVLVWEDIKQVIAKLQKDTAIKSE